MYWPYGSGEHPIFTKDELLWDKVSHERFLSLLEKGKVLDSERSTNSFGEWRFITLHFVRTVKKVKTDFFISFYGLGYHDSREKYFFDKWNIYESSSYRWKERKYLPKAEVLREVEEEYQEYKGLALRYNQKAQSKEARAFSLLVDEIGIDEDGALAEIEDMPGLLDLVE